MYNFREEIIAETVFVYPVSGADRVERVSGIERSRKPADYYDKAGKDSFADYLAKAQDKKAPRPKAETSQITEDLPMYGGMSYYNRHAMTAYFSMAASQTNFTC